MPATHSRGRSRAFAFGGNSCGDRLPLQDAAPPLQATLQAPFLSRGRESLGAPLPPGTIVEGLGAKAVLTARRESMVRMAVLVRP